MELTNRFGKLGNSLYYQARGIDNREVISNRPRKSLSIETTFPSNLENINQATQALTELYTLFTERLLDANISSPIKALFIKIKFSDFSQTSAETSAKKVHLDIFIKLFLQSYSRHQKPIRLLGLGVNFRTNEESDISQPELF